MISKRKRNTILVYCMASVVMLCALASNVTKVTTNLKTNSKKVVADNQTVESTDISYGLVALEASSCIEENKDAQKETEEKKEEKLEAQKKADKDKSSSKKKTTKKTTKTSTAKKTTTSKAKKTTSSKTTKKTTKTSSSSSDYIIKKVCTTEVVDKVVTAEDGTESTVQENVEKCTEVKEKVQKKKTANNTTSKRNALVAYAKKFNGKAYVMGGQWNGELPYRATDCSGFTRGVYKHFGYNLPRVARDQASVGKKVSFNNLQPGDLVFYSGNGGRSITHVALYIGNGKIIHAQTPRYGIGITSVNIMVKMTARRVIY